MNQLSLLWLKISNMFLLDGNTIMGKVVGLLCTVGTYVGVGLLAIGIFQFVMAIKDEDANGKSKAIVLIIAGILLFSLGTILDSILLGTDISRATISI